MIVTKENVHNEKILKELVHNASNNNNIQKVLADGAYDSKYNFRCLKELKIIPVIKVRGNSSIKNNINCIVRKLFVIEQFKDMEQWKKKHWYAMHWMIETAFSSIKRTCGKYVSSEKWNNIVNELMLKASIITHLLKRQLYDTE